MNITKRAEHECDKCDEIKLCSLIDDKIWYCNDCLQIEKAAIEATHLVKPLTDEEKLARYAQNPFGNRPKNVAPGMMSQISVNEILQQPSTKDTSIRVREDMLKAHTTAIIDVKKLIDADPAITNKPYALGETLMKWHEETKNVVFELNEKLVDAGHKQHAIQLYMNQFANQLRAEEREKLRIADINYKPAPPKTGKIKTITTHTINKTKKPKFNVAELRKAAASIGVSDFFIREVCMARSISVAEAVESIKQSIATAKK